MGLLLSLGAPDDQALASLSLNTVPSSPSPGSWTDLPLCFSSGPHLPDPLACLRCPLAPGLLIPFPQYYLSTPGMKLCQECRVSAVGTMHNDQVRRTGRASAGHDRRGRASVTAARITLGTHTLTAGTETKSPPGCEKRSSKYTCVCWYLCLTYVFLAGPSVLLSGIMTVIFK